MTANGKGIIIGAAAMLLLLALFALIVILTGAYSVAATDRHNPIVAWAFDTTYHNSVQGRADDLEAPQFTSGMIEAGAGEYKAMCAHCHGGVGVSPAGWAEVMQPHPPALARAAEKWTDEEVFWLVKHGVKMSGMPAFGPTHDDDTIWNIAAFVKEMPQLSAEEYAAIGSGGHGGEGGHSH